ncbi:MAG: tyrosine recombinase XerC [Clostridia bacterium]
MYDDVPELLREFLLYMSTIKNRSRTTTREYYYDLRHMFKFMVCQIDKINFSQLNDVDIKDVDITFIKKIKLINLYDYLGFLTETKSDKPATRARKVASIKSFFNYLCFKAKLLEVNPAVELETPKLGARIPKYLNLEESLNLLHCVDGKTKDRDFAILTLFLNCGLRLSELVSININHIKSDNTLIILGKGNKERSIHLNNSCIEAIKDHIASKQKDNITDREALFISSRGTRISKRMVELIVKKYIEQAGLDSRKYSPHKLRHTAATLMHKNGVDIRALQQVLGHESISTTEIYTHIDSDQIREALDRNPLNSI